MEKSNSVRFPCRPASGFKYESITKDYQACGFQAVDPRRNRDSCRNRVPGISSWYLQSDEKMLTIAQEQKNMEKKIKEQERALGA